MSILQLLFRISVSRYYPWFQLFLSVPVWFLLSAGCVRKEECLRRSAYVVAWYGRCFLLIFWLFFIQPFFHGRRAAERQSVWFCSKPGEGLFICMPCLLRILSCLFRLVCFCRLYLRDSETGVCVCWLDFCVPAALRFRSISPRGDTCSWMMWWQIQSEHCLDGQYGGWCGAGVKVMYRTDPGEFSLLPQRSSRFSNRKVSSSSISFSISLRLRSECSSSREKR